MYFLLLSFIWLPLPRHRIVYSRISLLASTTPQTSASGLTRHQKACFTSSQSGTSQTTAGPPPSFPMPPQGYSATSLCTPSMRTEPCTSRPGEEREAVGYDITLDRSDVGGQDCRIYSRHPRRPESGQYHLLYMPSVDPALVTLWLGSPANATGVKLPTTLPDGVSGTVPKSLFAVLPPRHSYVMVVHRALRCLYGLETLPFSSSGASSGHGGHGGGGDGGG
jgi:hypothetical protein